MDKYRNPYWVQWQNFVTDILKQGRLMTDEERRRADELVQQANRYERKQERRQAREQKRKAKRLAAGGSWGTRTQMQ